MVFNYSIGNRPSALNIVFKVIGFWKMIHKRVTKMSIQVTVNVAILTQVNFRSFRLRRHFHVIIFLRIIRKVILFVL